MSSYYDNQQQWSVTAPPAGQSSWETPASRSGANSVVPREEAGAFGSQLEEVDRAIDNLVKSGKMFSMPPRRDSMPMTGPGRAYPEFDPRMAGAGAPRHHSVSEFGGSERSFSASNLQNFYATQRHQPSRASEAEQVMQAKRRMAAQRERELRNYHQEQQYNRSVSAELSTFGGKPDRTMSPSGGMSEEERRELIARQKAALYGEGAFAEHSAYIDENGKPVPRTAPGPVTSLRGHSPLAFDHFGTAQQAQVQNGQSEGSTGEQQTPIQSQGQQSRSRANSTSSPSSNPTNSFGLFESSAQQATRTSTSSPGGSPPRQGGKAGPGASVAPIGTRPNGSSAQSINSAINKQRSTTPLPSPLSYGFAASEEGTSTNADRTASAASNPSAGAENVGLGWGGKGTVWGKNSSLNVQASVWG